MKNKKLFPLAMAAVMGVSLFAGCGQTGESSVESVSGGQTLRDCPDGRRRSDRNQPSGRGQSVQETKRKPARQAREATRQDSAPALTSSPRVPRIRIRRSRNTSPAALASSTPCAVCQCRFRDRYTTWGNSDYPEAWRTADRNRRRRA